MIKDSHTHFQGKDALSHVLETKVKGAIEPHGFELPGHLFAGLDTARHLALLILVLFIILSTVQPENSHNGLILLIFSIGALTSFAARSAWLGWSLLERLHRSLKQEHYEIQHHRSQEREELKALYSTKGFQGPLLEQVIDVLMADENRLLRVMLEEEMGLSLESHEHPLKHCFGALIGGLSTLIICSLSFYFLPGIFLVIVTFLIMGFTATLAAFLERNNLIPACVWSLGIGALAFGLVYFILQLFLPLLR